MSWNPVNLALRFCLELAALGSMGYWGWVSQDGHSRWVWAIGLPLLAASAWGVFRVPGDPKEAPVAVPGFVRLALEFVFFGLAVALLALAGQRIPAIAFAAVVVVHYVVSYDRIVWLLQQG